MGSPRGKSARKGLCSSLRVLVTYLHREGLLGRDLSPSVQAPKSYRLAGIPRSIPWSDVQRMLEGVDRRTGAGKRDYAILLLLVTYGLRSREVAALTLEDLDSSFIGAFLDHLEHKRGNSARSRNARLAAIRSFFRYLAYQVPEHSSRVQRVLAMPSKKYQRAMIDF